MKKLILAASVALAFFPASGFAQVLPPEAQKAFDRGVVAVQQQDWNLAIKYFDEADLARALNHAPTHAPTLFNLGLAHARAGHELPAIAWFHLYLIHAPNAPNAWAVRTEINRLDRALEARIQKILEEATALAMRAESVYLGSATWRNSALYAVAIGHVGAGDLQGALNTDKLFTSDVSRDWRPDGLDYIWLAYAEFLALETSDLPAAQAALARVRTSYLIEARVPYPYRGSDASLVSRAEAEDFFWWQTVNDASSLASTFRCWEIVCRCAVLPQIMELVTAPNLRERWGEEVDRAEAACPSCAVAIQGDARAAWLAAALQLSREKEAVDLAIALRESIGPSRDLWWGKDVNEAAGGLSAVALRLRLWRVRLRALEARASAERPMTPAH